VHTLRKQHKIAIAKKQKQRHNALKSSTATTNGMTTPAMFGPVLSVAATHMNYLGGCVTVQNICE